MTDGRWAVTGTYRAKLTPIPGMSGTTYSRRLTILSEGEYAVRAFHYRGGKLVTTSAARLVRRCPADHHRLERQRVDGPGARRDPGATRHAPGHRLHHAGRLGRPAADEALNGAAQFIWGDFEQVDADGLIWHTDGLQPGRYDWMRDSMPKWGTGCLVVAQRIDIDKMSHEDTHALPYLPADISFGDVSSAGMGCDRSIAFVTRIFSQTSPDPLEWHTDGLVPGTLRLEVLDGRLPLREAGGRRRRRRGRRFGSAGLGHQCDRGHAVRLRLHRRPDDVLADHLLHDGGRPHEDQVLSRTR